jgi:hypothetical protein
MDEVVSTVQYRDKILIFTKMGKVYEASIDVYDDRWIFKLINDCFPPK